MSSCRTSRWLLPLLFAILVCPSLSDDFEDMTTTTMMPFVVDTGTYVNCGHVKRLLDADGAQFQLGRALLKCWNRGVTMEELLEGVTSVSRRSNIEMYDYDVLYLPCKDVFKRNITRLTSRLMKDYLRCQSAGALDLKVQNLMDRRFQNIIEVYTIGNLSAEIDESTLVSCSNASKKVTMLCHHYGLTEEQWQRGFLRYYHNDKWVVEEDIADMSLTCDQVFSARIHEDVYEDPVEMFVRCQRTMPVDTEQRDLFEKKYAEKLMEFRALETGFPGADLRAHVSCRHLKPIHINRAAIMCPSWHANEICEDKGLTYNEIQDGLDERPEDDTMKRNVDDLYVSCESVFNEELWSFTTDLLHDYQSCRDADSVDKDSRRVIMTRFAKLFDLLASHKIPRSNADITEQLVSCSGFRGKLADLCRRRGASLAQELRGIGSLTRVLDDKWINTEALERLYVRCDDIFDDYAKFLTEMPLDQYMQCRWTEGLSESSKKFIDEKIGKVYENKHKWNGTRYIGDADVEITSYILFDTDE